MKSPINRELDDRSQDCGDKMAICVDRLVKKIRPAVKAHTNLIRHRSISMANAVIILVP